MTGPLDEFRANGPRRSEGRYLRRRPPAPPDIPAAAVPRPPGVRPTPPDIPAVPVSRPPEVRLISILGRGIAIFVPLLILVGLTPVIASFGSIGSDKLSKIVFFGGETGSTSGDGPWTLYKLLFWIIVGVVVYLMLIMKLLNVGNDWQDCVFVFAASTLVGFLIFVLRMFFASEMVQADWYWAPVTGCIGFTIAALKHGRR